MNEVVLYDYWRSSASYRVRIALNMLEIDHKTVSINLLEGEQRGPDYLALNPQGLVPALVIDGRTLTQSLSIIEQAYRKIKDMKGAESEIYHADAPSYYLPPKEDVYTKMEALIWHFKIVMGETDIPPGEVYQSVEGGNGEVGYYLISDGGRTPYRLHFRRPCFIYYQAYSELTKGAMLSDAIIVMSSLNLIAGEMDA